MSMTEYPVTQFTLSGTIRLAKGKMARAQQWASSRSLQRLDRLATGSATFLAHATPTVGQLLTHTQRRQGKPLLAATVSHPPITNQVKVAQVQGAAQASEVQECERVTGEGAYGWVPLIIVFG